MSSTVLPKPRSRPRPIVRNEEPFLVSSTSPANAVEYVNSQREFPLDVDLEACRCGKCDGPIDAAHECRFYGHRGGKNDGLSMAAHAHCVPSGDGIQVSLHTAVHIFLRQSSRYSSSRRGRKE